MNKKQAQAIVKNIEKHMKAVAKTRDNLDDYISTLEELKEDCSNAYDRLQEARDALSEIV